MEDAGEVGWAEDWGGVLVGVGVAALFLAFPSFCRSGIDLFSRLPPPTLWPKIN